MSDDNEVRKLISLARSKLMLSLPFFGMIAIPMQVDMRKDIPTAATDGRSLMFNPAFTKALTPPELRFVIAHEVMHVALDHVSRLQGRDPRKWNVACDYVINLELSKMERSGMKMPKCGLIDQKYAGLSADEVYNLLPDSQCVGGEGAGDNADPGGCGGIMLPEGGPAEVSSVCAEARVRVQQALTASASSPGSMPDSLRKMLEAAEPLVDWRPLLRRFIDEHSSSDFTWSQPSRRTIALGLYLPNRNPEPELRHLVCVVDSSGSCFSDKQLSEFLGEVEGACDAAQIRKVTVLSADTRVHTSQTFELGEKIQAKKIKIQGGGGTSFRQPFEHIRKECDDASLVIYFTDLEVHDFGECELPVLWAAYGTKDRVAALAAKTPFGETIHVND